VYQAGKKPGVPPEWIQVNPTKYKNVWVSTKKSSLEMLNALSSSQSYGLKWKAYIIFKKLSEAINKVNIVNVTGAGFFESNV